MEQTEDKPVVRRMTGLFTGILNSADGSWVLMPQLRRFTSVGAWMVWFGMTTYMANIPGQVATGLFDMGALGMLASVLIYPLYGALSFCAFLWIGGRLYGVETKGDQRLREEAHAKK